MLTEMNQARRLGRQLAADGSSPVEITEVIINAFDGDTPRSVAFRLAFADRVRSLKKSKEANHE